MTDLEAVRKRWLQERSAYEAFGKNLEERLRIELLRAGIWAKVTSRAKEMDSFIRKLIKKPEHDYESVGDKSGVRAVLRYKSEVETVLALAARSFDCGEPEDKIDTLRPDQVGYLGTHVDIRLRRDDPLVADYPPDRFRAEFQIHTLAQNLWAEMSHDAFYKNDEDLSPLSNWLKRRIYRLAGVVEVADDEFNRLNAEMPDIPELKLLKALERHYYKLTARRSDPEVSLDLIRLLLPLYKRGAQQVAVHLEEFYSKNEEAIRDVYEQAEDDPERSAYLYQPEALMIYDRLRADPTGVRKAWNVRFPERELERLALAFGISFA